MGCFLPSCPFYAFLHSCTYPNKNSWRIRHVRPFTVRPHLRSLQISNLCGSNIIVRFLGLMNPPVLVLFQSTPALIASTTDFILSVLTIQIPAFASLFFTYSGPLFLQTRPHKCTVHSSPWLPYVILFLGLLYNFSLLETKCEKINDLNWVKSNSKK